MHDSAQVKQLKASLAAARALVASLEAAIEQAEQPQADPALTLEAAAKAAQLSPHTLRSWCKSGRLKCSRGPRSSYLVRLSDIDAALAAGPALPAQRKRTQPADVDSWDAEAEREFRVLAGGRKA